MLTAVALAAVLTVPAGAHAGGRYDVIPYRGMVGLNPLGIPFDVFSVEVEGLVGPGVTVGAAGSYNRFGGDLGAGGRDPRFSSGDIKVRYYPSEVPFQGFAVGLAVGITSYSSSVDILNPGPTGPFEERQSMRDRKSTRLNS